MIAIAPVFEHVTGWLNPYEVLQHESASWARATEKALIQRVTSGVMGTAESMAAARDDLSRR